MDLGSFMEWALASSLLLTSVVAVVTLSRYFGGRARSELEVVSRALAARDATIKEKDQQIEGMGKRLARLDEERAEYGGSKVYEALLVQQQEMAAAFREISDQMQKHEQRAGDRAKQMLGLIETVGNELARCFHNGQDDEGKR